MSTPLRIGGFVAVLALVFGVALGIGRLAGDEDDETAAGQERADAYAVVLDRSQADAGKGVVRFTVQDEHREVVTDFDVRHEKRLHLIAVDTGYSGYQHLHPTMTADGTWSTPIELAPGLVRLYADFRPHGGEDTVATANVEVPGVVGSPGFSLLRSVKVDGYTVTALGDLEAGDRSRLRFEVGRNGGPVEDLEPYLGAYGHLVILRASDGEYLHVHPEGGPPGPTIAFEAEVPTSGRHHLYLDFKHVGVVRTAHFVIDAGQAPAQPGEEGANGHGDH